MPPKALFLFTFTKWFIGTINIDWKRKEFLFFFLHFLWIEMSGTIISGGCGWYFSRGKPKEVIRWRYQSILLPQYVSMSKQKKKTKKEIFFRHSRIRILCLALLSQREDKKIRTHPLCWRMPAFMKFSMQFFQDSPREWQLNKSMWTFGLVGRRLIINHARVPRVHIDIVFLFQGWRWMR